MELFKSLLTIFWWRMLLIYIIAVNCCGRQLAQRLGWVAPAYHKKESASLHLGVCKFSLQYDGFGVRVGTWNLHASVESL